MLRTPAFRLTFCVIITGLLLAQTKKVNLKDAGFLIGTVTETDTHYVVETKFGPVNVPKDQVVSIEDHLTLEDQYRRRLAKIDPKSPEDRFELAKWAFSQDMLATARAELLSALELKKDYERARLLLRQVEARLDAAAVAKEAPPPEQEKLQGDTRPAPTAQFDRRWLLTDEEISRIRLQELRPDETVRFRFTNNVLNRFIELMKGRGDFEDPRFAATFRKYPRPRQLAYILKTIPRDADDLKKDIIVTSDPMFMNNFRREIWPLVARSCASARCHGGVNVIGGFRTLNLPGRTKQVDYTNFLIMDSYARRGRKMVDRDRTDLSLLLQFGLPGDKAEYPHPAKIPPVYPDVESMNYIRVRDWIESLKGPPHPGYDIEPRIPWVTRPGPAPTTQPAAKTRPATTPPVEAENAD